MDKVGSIVLSKFRFGAYVLVILLAYKEIKMMTKFSSMILNHLLLNSCMPCSRVNPKSILRNVVVKLVTVKSPIAEPK
jgi:hypothetical protein